MKKNIILFFMAAVSVFIVFLAADKYWAPFDEGIITVAAQRLIAGEVPYKDFFIVMYPPGQLFAVASLYKIFGVSLEAGRFFSAFSQLILLFSVIGITGLITKDKKAVFMTWLAALTCLAPRTGAIPSPIWTGMAFSMCAIYAFVGYARTKNPSKLLLAALLTGLAVSFRHDIGLFLAIAILCGIVSSGATARNIIFFMIFAAVIPLLTAVYFLKKGALPDMLDSLVRFPFVHEKTANLPFPAPCFDLNMIFHRSLHFINVNQYYIPVLAYFSAFLYMTADFLKEKRLAPENNGLFVLFLFGLFTFNQVRIRPDPAHLLTVIFPSFVILAVLSNKIFSQNRRRSVLMPPSAALVILSLFLVSMLMVKNTDKSFKNIIRKPFKKDISYVKFDKGGVYIPKEEKDEVVDTVDFINKNTGALDRVYLGNVSHDVDAFGGSLVLYTLFDRLPSTKYYELLPGLVTSGPVQVEIRDSLIKYGVKYCILQDIEEPKEKSGPRGILDTYIYANYSLKQKIGKYNIYEKNSIH